MQKFVSSDLLVNFYDAARLEISWHCIVEVKADETNFSVKKEWNHITKRLELE